MVGPAHSYVVLVRRNGKWVVVAGPYSVRRAAVVEMLNQLSQGTGDDYMVQNEDGAVVALIEG